MPRENIEAKRKQILAQNHTKKENISIEEAEEHFEHCLDCQSKMEEYAELLARE